MAVVYSAMGGGVLLLLPASQILIDHVGWRGTYQLFGVIVLVVLLPVAAVAVAAFRRRRTARHEEG